MSLTFPGMLHHTALNESGNLRLYDDVFHNLCIRENYDCFVDHRGRAAQRKMDPSHVMMAWGERGSYPLRSPPVSRFPPLSSPGTESATRIGPPKKANICLCLLFQMSGKYRVGFWRRRLIKFPTVGAPLRRSCSADWTLASEDVGWRACSFRASLAARCSICRPV